jgi:hypothetical protein
LALFLDNPPSGPLAQLVEQLTFNQWVAGSNPARLTTEISDLYKNLRKNTRYGCATGRMWAAHILWLLAVYSEQFRTDSSICFFINMLRSGELWKCEKPPGPESLRSGQTQQRIQLRSNEYDLTEIHPTLWRVAKFLRHQLPVPAGILGQAVVSVDDRVGRGKDRQVNMWFLVIANHYVFEPAFCNPAAG